MTDVNPEAPAARKPKRSAKEIAQGHADKAAEAVEKHDEKLGKIDGKINKLEQERVALEAKREELVREADYRAMHPLLQEDEIEAAEVADRATGEPDEPQPSLPRDIDQPF